MWALHFAFVISAVSTLDSSSKEGQPCTTPTHDEGKCIRFKDCESLLEVILRNPLYKEDITFLKNSQCGYDKEPLVCCTDSLSTLYFPSTETLIPNVTEETSSNGTEKEPTDTFIVLSDLLPNATICRVRPTPHLIGGRARENEFPWLALLKYSKPNNEKGFHCGGVLINERYVLTAAHCIVSTEMEKLKWVLSSVRLGEYDISMESDCYRDKCTDPPLDIAVQKLISHEKFASTSNSLENDIALIRLSQPVKYTRYIKPICLPGGDRLKALIYDDVALEIAGWGTTENSNYLTKCFSSQSSYFQATTISATFSNVKRRLFVLGIPNDKCNDIYQSRNHITLTNNQLCAGGLLDQDSCRVDNGGPLMYVDRTNIYRPYWYCAGIVSFRPIPCGKEGFPVVYTRISSYTDWIVQNIQP